MKIDSLVLTLRSRFSDSTFQTQNLPPEILICASLALRLRMRKIVINVYFPNIRGYGYPKLIGKARFVPQLMARREYTRVSWGETAPLLLVYVLRVVGRPSTLRRRRRKGLRIKCRLVTNLDFCSSPRICLCPSFSLNAEKSNQRSNSSASSKTSGNYSQMIRKTVYNEVEETP